MYLPSSIDWMNYAAYMVLYRKSINMIYATAVSMRDTKELFTLSLILQTNYSLLMLNMLHSPLETVLSNYGVFLQAKAKVEYLQPLL